MLILENTNLDLFQNDSRQILVHFLRYLSPKFNLNRHIFIGYMIQPFEKGNLIKHFIHCSQCKNTPRADQRSSQTPAVPTLAQSWIFLPPPGWRLRRQPSSRQPINCWLFQAVRARFSPRRVSNEAPPFPFSPSCP